MLTLIYALVLAHPEFVRIPQKKVLPQLHTTKIWVFFTDKGIFNEQQYQLALNAWKKAVHPAGAKDFYDLPVSRRYLQEIEALGARLRTISNWLNAASFELPPELIPEVARLPFVYDIKPVGVKTDAEPELILPIPQPERPARTADTAESHRFYGAAWDQAQMLGVPEVFFKGYFGSGVKLALFDTGIKLKHTAVQRLRITGQYDFISGDNCYFARSNTPHPTPIPELRYLGLVKHPVLEGNQNSLILAFVADSFNYPYGLPARALFFSYSSDRGATWHAPQPISISRPYYYTYENLCALSRDSVTYLAFNEVNLNPGGQPTCYLGYFTGATWRNRLTVGTGRNPALATWSDTLYLAYITTDSLITLKKYPIPNLNPEPPLTSQFRIDEPASEIKITVAPDGVVNIFCLSRTTGRLWQYRSQDGGNTFTLAGPLGGENARLPRLVSDPSMPATKLLLYLDESAPPLTRLVARISGDYGSTWGPGTTVDSALNIGTFSAFIDTDIKIIYETAGLLYQTVSTDLGASWQPAVAIDTTGFAFGPNIFGLNGEPLYLWFRRGDENAVWEDSDTLRFSREQPNHGTRMASIIAGYQPYSLMGIAPGVSLLLARTEYYKTSSNRYYEYNMEEDTYIQALEWAAKCGADIVSTSLGYREFYTDDQFDGRTIPVSIAAELAAKKGMLIVTAMGNRDTTTHPWPRPYIVAPGDAEGVITCGGVEKNMLPWRGTGTGPTADGRVKPDLVALADTVAVAAPDSEYLLEGSVGTSCATALIAGCCALLKEAHPNWSADSIKSVLFMTATLPVKSCTFGFGVPRVDSAFKLFPPVPQSPPIPGDEIGAIFPNPFVATGENRVYFPLNLTRLTPEAKITILTPSGKLIKTINLNTDQMSTPGRYREIPILERIGAYWDGKNESDNPVASGLYLAVFQTTFGRNTAKFFLVRKP